MQFEFPVHVATFFVSFIDGMLSSMYQACMIEVRKKEADGDMVLLILGEAVDREKTGQSQQV
jgi:hypothetical protein